jgi:branched-subunit amino acid ABC-type transport system permease component
MTAGSLLAGVVGLLIGIEVGVRPTAGFSYLIYGIIAMVLGGNETLIGTLLGALVLASVQNATGYFVDSKWSSTLSYALLITFLFLRPEGIRAPRLAMDQR